MSDRDVARPLDDQAGPEGTGSVGDSRLFSQVLVFMKGLGRRLKVRGLKRKMQGWSF